jgi:hypothetical protein
MMRELYELDGVLPVQELDGAELLPPAGFLEMAVARALGEVHALEAMQHVERLAAARADDAAVNDVKPRPARKRCDSGVIFGALVSDDSPTLPFIRLAHD